MRHQPVVPLHLRCNVLGNLGIQPLNGQALPLITLKDAVLDPLLPYPLGDVPEPDRNCGGELLVRNLDSPSLHAEQMRNRLTVFQPASADA
jgi:hypothetical protein